jgi:DNA-binding MarR family transcriptional regulator
MKTSTYTFGLMQSRAYRALQEQIHEALGAYDLNPSYWSMLGIICEAQDGIRQVEIARKLDVKPPLITAMVRELENRELIQSMQNQFDARAKLVALTPKGKKYIKLVEAGLQSTINKLLDGATENDIRAYHKVLKTIVSNQGAKKRNN